METKFVVLTDKYIKNYKEKFCKGLDIDVRYYIAEVMNNQELIIRLNADRYRYIFSIRILKTKENNHINMLWIIKLYEHFKVHFKGTRILIQSTDVYFPKNVFLEVRSSIIFNKKDYYQKQNELKFNN